mmetsp:Transcript_60098/g.107247  ORF Transcript_60098/g.107247 Transcript_60098/m.107247 type:complete len:227 (-) Transcript_60098:1354-2034(-)
MAVLNVTAPGLHHGLLGGRHPLRLVHLDAHLPGQLEAPQGLVQFAPGLNVLTPLDHQQLEAEAVQIGLDNLLPRSTPEHLRQCHGFVQGLISLLFLFRAVLLGPRDVELPEPHVISVQVCLVPLDALWLVQQRRHELLPQGLSNGVQQFVVRLLHGLRVGRLHLLVLLLAAGALSPCCALHVVQWDLDLLGDVATLPMTKLRVLLCLGDPQPLGLLLLLRLLRLRL